MKIGFDAKRYFNNTTGLGNYSRWLIDNLASIQNSSLLLYHPKEQQTQTKFQAKSPSGLWQYLSSVWRMIGIKTDLKRDGIEIYHGLSNELPFGIHKLEIKTVVTIHDLINKRYPENYKWIDRLIYHYKLDYAQKNADIIITPSEATKQDITHFFNTDHDKIKVIPLSLPSIPEIKKPISNKEYILCVSSFNKRKNIARLVDAYLSINTETKLILAGARGDTSKLIEEKTANQPNIEIMTNVSAEKLAELYSGSLFCIYPSLFEGFGIPILEAFQHGKTVATSDVSSMPEVGGDAAEYFNPLDTSSITRAIMNLLSEQHRQAKESKVSSQLARFESSELIKKYQEIYTSLIS
ncbi:MAG: glycosyltransferase family 4 protein [Bacteroidia bacterium]